MNTAEVGIQWAIQWAIKSCRGVMPVKTSQCMIEIFRGEGAGVVTLSRPLPYEQLLPFPTTCFKMFLERNLNDPHPHHPTSSIFLCYPPPYPPPLPTPLKILIVRPSSGVIPRKLPPFCHFGYHPLEFQAKQEIWKIIFHTPVWIENGVAQSTTFPPSSITPIF